MMTAIDYNKCRLSTRFFSGGFSFLVYYPKKEEVLYEKEMLCPANFSFYEWLKAKLASEEYLHYNYERTHIIYEPEKYSLVPTKLIKKDKRKDILTVTHPIDDNDKILEEDAGTYQILYVIPEQVFKLLKGCFSKTIWQSNINILLASLLGDKKWQVSVQILNNNLYIAVSKNNKLQMCNDFNFRTKHDLLYYVLYIFHNLEIPIDESRITLSGRNDYLQDLLYILKNYHNDIYVPDLFSKEKNSSIPIRNFILKSVV